MALSEYMDYELNAMSRAIQDEIDEQIVVDMLIECGWHEVELTTLFFKQDFYDWIDANVKHDYKQHNMRFVFEDMQDANWFKLRWQ